MKWFLIILAGLLLLLLIAYAVMAMQSQKTPADLGLKDGFLRLCPDSPNCVCSEAHSQSDAEHAIEPLAGDDWDGIKGRIIRLGGMIEQDDGRYLHATFTSPVFRYVDDVELRLDEGNKLIHIRSASRIGRSDFGINRKRVEQLKAQ